MNFVSSIKEEIWNNMDIKKHSLRFLVVSSSSVVDQFPEKLIKPFILGTSTEGDTILDPFLGIGTTAKVSLDNGRKCVGYEISPVFVDTSFQLCGEGLIQERVKVM